jgi:hypothetical protein
MLQLARVTKISVASLIVGGLSFTSLPAVASTDRVVGSTSGSSVTSNPDVTESEVNELANNLEELFTNGIVNNQDGTFTVNEAAILGHFGPEEGNAIISQFQQQIPQSLNKGGVVSTDNYGQCVLNFTGFGTLFGASEGTILGYINRQEWNKAAQTMVKFLGKQAVRGGAVGLAASLAAGGAWCATPWAS